MIVIVDANILISGIINPYGAIPELILLKKAGIDFVIPEYAIQEITSHKSRICKETETSVFHFEQLLSIFLSNILIFSTDTVKQPDIIVAEKLVTSIDLKDLWYIALAIALDALLWTGDLKLYKGLRKKGFKNIITTAELKSIIKGF